MRRFVALFSLSTIILGSLVMSADARPQYKSAYSKKQFTAETEAEKALGAAITKDSCNACHVKGEKKTVRNDMGKKLHEALGGKSYKFDKAAWADGKLEESIKAFRAAINKKAEK